MSGKAKFKASAVAEALTANSGMVYETAEKLGCTHKTIYNYIKRHPTVKIAFDAARGKMLDTAELGLRKAIDSGEQWAITFALRTIGKDRGYTEKFEAEVSGPGGKPLAVVHYMPGADDAVTIFDILAGAGAFQPPTDAGEDDALHPTPAVAEAGGVPAGATT